jgi:putative redox protein
MNSENLEFTNQTGQTLSAILEIPVGAEPRAYAVFAHCFTCGKNIKAATYVARALAAEGIATLRFDFTGLGESEGEFAETNFSSNVDDLVAAAEFLEHEYDAPAILVGHSLGGAAVLQAAARVPSVRAVATVAAPAEPAHIAHLFADVRPEVEERGEVEVDLAGRRFRIQKQFFDDLEKTRMERTIAALGRPVLILHAPDDEIVEFENAARIYEAASQPKSFVSLDGADHLLSNSREARYAGSLIAAWASRYIPEASSPEPADEGWTVAYTGDSGYYTEVMAGEHMLVSDEPTSYGGTDLGPSPYQLLSAALGACTTMTLRMYADRKEWPLDGVTVRLRHSKVHAKDCGECETREGRIDRIVREIIPHGDLSTDQRERLLEIADRCPVHRTLHSEIDVQSKLKELS